MSSGVDFSRHHKNKSFSVYFRTNGPRDLGASRFRTKGRSIGKRWTFLKVFVVVAYCERKEKVLHKTGKPHLLNINFGPNSHFFHKSNRVAFAWTNRRRRFSYTFYKKIRIEVNPPVSQKMSPFRRLKVSYDFFFNFGRICQFFTFLRFYIFWKRPLSSCL